MANFEYSEKINGLDVPFRIYIEKRKSVRVSFGRSCINLRIPVSLSQSLREQHFKKAILWVRDHVHKNPDAISGYLMKDYDSLSELTIYGKKFQMQILYETRKTGKADFIKKPETILLTLPDGISGKDKNKMIKQLLSRICAQMFLPEFSARVTEINETCFHKEIKSVNLKYNKSNWGSCSSATNLNFSTRLLFAPKPVIDYVIIHELAHLYEMNHSSKFWNIVSQIMPDYKEKEEWLKINGKTCDF